MKPTQFHSACPAGGNKLKKFKHLWTLEPYLFLEKHFVVSLLYPFRIWQGGNQPHAHQQCMQAD